LTNGKVLDDINNIYKGINIVPNVSNSVIEFSGTACIVAANVWARMEEGRNAAFFEQKK
jgi:hypothetical protein